MYTRSLHKRTCSNSPFEATTDKEKGKSDDEAPILLVLAVVI